MLRLDKRIGPYAYLSAGLGISGGNIERDLVAVRELAKEWGANSAVPEAFLVNSRHRKNWALKMLHEQSVLSGTPVEGGSAALSGGKPTIAIWGLAYKADTKSTKNSPSLDLLKNLAPFTVRIYDPQAVLDKTAYPHATQTASALEACRGANALVVMTPWKEFSGASAASIRETLAGRVILDPFGILDAGQCRKLGLKYFTLGQASKGDGI